MNTLLSLKNNVSKIQNLIISGEVGATGPTGPQGNRGTALDVNFFGDLDNTKLAEVLNDSTIDSTNAYVIVVSTDGSTIGTRTNSLTGIDTPGSLSDLSNHLIIFDGLQWVDHGVFVSIKGDTTIKDQQVLKVNKDKEFKDLKVLLVALVQLVQPDHKVLKVFKVSRVTQVYVVSHFK